MPRKNDNGKSHDEVLLRFCEKHQEEHQRLHDAVAKNQAHIEVMQQGIEALRPRRGDKWVMWTLVFMMLTTLVGGVWFIGEKVMERPTSPEVQKVYEPLQQDVREVLKEQAEHRILLKDLHDDMQDIKNDLKEIKSK